MAKRVAIIGAGASGLTAIKCCLDEGLEPVCLERTGEIGGLWNFTEDAREGQACVMKSTVINTSKEMMSYSDFPIPKEFAIFMHNTYVNKYFHLYADKFGLKKHIRLNTEVLSVSATEDFKQTGRWDMEIQDENKMKTRERFDALLICTGHHADTHKPTFQGQEKFKGKILHSHDYKDMRGYEDKRIVIIGIGNSGGDMAVELSRISKVFLSTRRGSWVLNRVSDNGLPLDMASPIASRIGLTVMNCLPRSLINSAVEKQLNKRFDHERYSLKPQHALFAQHPTVNDDIPNRIICGSLCVKSNVKCITETGVEFDDGSFEDNIDIIVLATGYIFGFPFMDKSIIDVQNNRVQLYKYMFPPDLEKYTCAVIGCFQPLGAIMPIAEMQCRLAAQVFKGMTKLPTRGEMWCDIKQKEIAMAHRYVATQRHTIQVDYVPIMDELAELVGCKPDFKQLFKTDPKLAWNCVSGPCTPYQYRLMGRNSWPGARDAILTQWDRTFYPLKTRPVVPSSTSQSSLLIRYCIYLLIIALVLSWLF